jgi:hypothetical protein
MPGMRVGDSTLWPPDHWPIVLVHASLFFVITPVPSNGKGCFFGICLRCMPSVFIQDGSSELGPPFEVTPSRLVALRNSAAQ